MVYKHIGHKDGRYDLNSMSRYCLFVFTVMLLCCRILKIKGTLHSNPLLPLFNVTEQIVRKQCMKNACVCRFSEGKNLHRQIFFFFFFLPKQTKELKYPSFQNGINKKVVSQCFYIVYVWRIPATFSASNSLLGTLFPLRTACLLSD